MANFCKILDNFKLNITLFIFITLVCGTYNILWNIPHIHAECEECSADDNMLSWQKLTPMI